MAGCSRGCVIISVPSNAEEEDVHVLASDTSERVPKGSGAVWLPARGQNLKKTPSKKWRMSIPLVLTINVFLSGVRPPRRPIWVPHRIRKLAVPLDDCPGQLGNTVLLEGYKALVLASFSSTYEWIRVSLLLSFFLSVKSLF
ncbi:hypothetical protein ACOSP7_022314 [Xanthoceras sorbifolium]